MLYAHLLGYLSNVRYAGNKTPFVKCLVKTSLGEELEIRVFGEDNLRDLEDSSLIKVTKTVASSGTWEGVTFYNGKPVGVSRMKFFREMDFSIANGFSLSSLN